MELFNVCYGTEQLCYELRKLELTSSVTVTQYLCATENAGEIYNDRASITY